jgi:hypothetical protein
MSMAETDSNARFPLQRVQGSLKGKHPTKANHGNERPPFFAMKRRRTGKYVAVPTQGEPYRAFVPDPLPPVPPLCIDESLRGKLDSALLALGRLDSLASLLPDTMLVCWSVRPDLACVLAMSYRCDQATGPGSSYRIQ